MFDNKLYVGHMNFTTTEDSLRDLFSQFGEVKYVKVIQGKGFGFVQLSSEEEVEKAIQELDGYNFEGFALKVAKAKPMDKTRRDGGNGAGRGPRSFSGPRRKPF